VLTARRNAGARVILARANGSPPLGNDVLFVINEVGTLIPVTTSHAPTPHPGDTLVLLTGSPR
jgi:hypothetical protein